MSFALSYITESQWAITEEGLNTLISIASRTNDLLALEKSIGKKPSYSHASTVRSGIGIIPIQGPTFKRANLLTDVSGASSYELILRDLYSMLESSEVKAILLNIDSPGGEANGCAELSEHIFEARQRKPIYAFVGGMGASAAYWLASATCKIFASETSLLGSIGVQTVIRSKDKTGEVSFVSSLSPNKNLDPASELGAKEVQRTVDDLGKIFVQKIARNREVTPEFVTENFGQGSIFISEKALEKGMVDAITTLEGALVTINSEIKSETNLALSASEELQSAVAKAKKSEAERILGIQAIANGRVSADFTASLISDGISLEEAALQILKRSDSEKGLRIEELKKADLAFAKLDSKPSSVEEDAFENDLRFAQSLGLVSIN